MYAVHLTCTLVQRAYIYISRKYVSNVPGLLKEMSSVHKPNNATLLVKSIDRPMLSCGLR